MFIVDYFPPFSFIFILSIWYFTVPLFILLACLLACLQAQAHECEEHCLCIFVLLVMPQYQQKKVSVDCLHICFLKHFFTYFSVCFSACWFSLICHDDVPCEKKLKTGENKKKMVQLVIVEGWLLVVDSWCEDKRRKKNVDD